jgi:hypothetical protein
MWQVAHATDIFAKLFSDLASRRKVLGLEGNVRTSEIEQRFLGLGFKHVDRHTDTPPELCEILTTSGSRKGSKRFVTFTEVPDGTKVEVSAETKGVMMSIFGRLFRKRMARRIDGMFDVIARYIEATK